MDHHFFESVLASSGRYCIALISGASVKQKFSEYLLDLLDVAEEADESGTNAYFALATFGDTDSRTAANAKYLRSLYLDIDCGADKPYVDVQAGADALSAFVDSTGLPEPIVVLSGGGLHVYWPMTKDLPVAEWQPLARALKALCKAKGLHADPAVTADAARILRIPGTHNHKPTFPQPPQVVVAHRGAGPTDPEDLKAKLPVVELPVDLTAAKVFGTDSTTRALASSDLDPAKFQIIAKKSLGGSAGCGQIKHALVSAAELSEPEWRAALSIAWNCTDGAKAIHKLSAAHPEYTPENTIAKAERLTGKPHTCAWYKENYPAACAGCAHKITSPIQLGVFVEEAPSAEGGYVIATKVAADDPQVAPRSVELRIPKYPFPFFRGANGGVYKKKVDDKDESGATTTVEVYKHDLYVTGRFYDNNADNVGDGELIGVDLHLPHDGVRQFHIPVTHIVAKDRLRDALAKQGVVVMNEQLGDMMSYIAKSLQKLQTELSAARTRSQMGWTPEGTFIIGELEYGFNKSIRLAPPTAGSRKLASCMVPTGSLEEWADVIKEYNKPGMESHAFAFLVGVGSPTLSLQNSTQVKGAMVNLVSNQSGTGKTTVQLAVNSVYGNPSELLMDARDTAAARFHRLGTLNSIAMTVDELTNIQPDELSPIVYGSTSGRGAHRMEAQGNRLRANETTWCSVTITSSNAVLSDTLSAHKVASDGEQRRILDIRVNQPEGMSKEASDALFGKLSTNYGLAGPLIAQYLVDNRQQVEDMVRAKQILIDREFRFERADRFYSAVFAACYGGALLLKETGIYEFDIDRILRVAYDNQRKLLSSAADTSAAASEGTMGQVLVSQYIVENIQGALVVNSSKLSELQSAAIHEPRGPFKYRLEPDTKEVVIPAAALRDYFVAKRVDLRSAMNQMFDAGLLKPAPDGRQTAVRRVLAGSTMASTSPTMRCYVFDAEALGAMEVEIGTDPNDMAAGSEG